MTATELTPCSPIVRQQLGRLKADKYSVYFLTIPFFLFVGILLIGGYSFALTTALLGTFTTIIVWLTLPHVRKNFAKECEKLYLDNHADFLLAKNFRDILEWLPPSSPVDFQNPEPVIPGNWRPFRVEYVIGSTIRGDLSQIQNGNVFAGHIMAESCPDFLNMSTILFLVEPETGRTLRALIPNQQATQELFTGIIKNWKRRVDYGTHASQAIEDCARRFSEISAATMHHDFIDRLAASCDKPLNQRPMVTVQGLELQQGVALATTFTVNHEKAHALPSGLLGDLATRTEKIFLPPKPSQPIRALPHPGD